jgi:hypothetical protein
MKFKKIIYLNYSPLTRRDYEVFFMEEVLRYGIEIEYWDLTMLLFESTFDQEDASFLVKTIKIKTYQDLRQAIIQQTCLEKILFISIMNFGSRIARIHILLQKYRCILGYFARNQLPNFLPKYHILKKILRLNIKKILNLCYNYKVKYNLRRGVYKKYDFVFLGGRLGIKSFGKFRKIYKNSRILKINSWDYDNYLKNDRSERIIDDNYILFLDEYLPFHPDFKMISSGDKVISPDKYFGQLNDYFDRIEKQFSLPVVIAAHPRSLKYMEHNYFSGRKICFGVTCQLAKYANFILAHTSTSIDYAILYNKPIHIITSKIIKKKMPVYHEGMMARVRYIGCNYQYFDDKSDALIGETNAENYNRYKYDYLTFQETENVLSSDIFINFLTKD